MLIVQNDTFDNIWQNGETFINMLSEKGQAIPVNLGADKESSKIYEVNKRKLQTILVDDVI